MKTLHLFIPLDKKVQEYIKDLSNSINEKFKIVLNPWDYAHILKVPILSTVSEDKLNEMLEKISSELLLENLVVGSPGRDTKISDPNIFMGLSEKSYFKVYQFQEKTLELIKDYIDVSNPIISQPDKIDHPTPQRYLTEYGTDDLLKWYYSNCIYLGEVKDYRLRKEVFSYIHDEFNKEFVLSNKLAWKIV